MLALVSMAHHDRRLYSRPEHRPDPTPGDDPRSHRRDCLVVGHVDLDTQSGAVRSLNLVHLEAVEHREDIVV